MLDKDTVDLLEKVPLFQGLSKRELNAIARVTREVSFPDGEYVVHEGASGVGFHLIVDGTAEVRVSGEPRATLGEGQFFGEISLIDGGPRTADVVATSPLKVLSLASWDFMALIEEHPKIARAMLIDLCTKLRSLEQWSRQQYQQVGWIQQEEPEEQPAT